jgi:hypothetical protein
MRPDVYYRRALWSPFVLLAVGALTWRISGWGAFVAIVHLYAIVPYAIGLVLASRWIAREHSLREIRIAMWATPFILAIGFASAIFIMALSRTWSSDLSVKAVVGGPGTLALVWGLGALVVGYAYVVLIEVGFLLGRWSRLIRT